MVISTHLKLCLVTAVHNFKWVKKTHICLIWEQLFANHDVWTVFSFSRPVIQAVNKIYLKRL